jgi:hypothetical protein
VQRFRKRRPQVAGGPQTRAAGLAAGRGLWAASVAGA